MAFIPTIVAQGQSTFTTGDRRHDVLFAVTIPDSSFSKGDIYFYIEGPSYSSWIGEGVAHPPIILSNRGAGLGFGKSMKDALMLIAYTAGKNHSGMDIWLQVARELQRAEFRASCDHQPEAVLQAYRANLQRGSSHRQDRHKD